MAEEKCIVGLDIGTNVVRVAVGEIDYEGKLSIVATSSKKSAGIRVYKTEHIQIWKSPVVLQKPF